MRPLPFSYSSLSTFINCPRRYHAQYVLKEVRDDPDTPHLVWGNRVHKDFEDRQRDGKDLPADVAHHEDEMRKLDALPGEKTYEAQVGFTRGFKPTGFFAADVVYRAKIDWMAITKHQVTIVDYKGLPIDTLISTPDGFTSMSAVQVGDMVHGSDGVAYPVLVKSPVTMRPCFEVKFDDKTSAICDNVHLWSLANGSVVPVTELLKGHEMLVAAPVQMPSRDLPIDPYVLGIWLADGKHTSGEVSKPDEFIWREVERRGYELGVNTGKDGGCPTRTIKGIRGHLTAMGLMRNKHIPESYHTASIEQRLDLLRGLMDGDGNANHVRCQTIFSNLNRRLIDDVAILVNSLGERGTVVEHTYSGFGKTGRAWRVNWRPVRFNPFLLPRKAKGLETWGPGRSWKRRVVGVTPVEARETACIGVGSPDNTYLCTAQRLVTHNTGKPNPKWLQLELNAIWAFNAHPQVSHVEMSFYWTQTKQVDTQVMRRHDWARVWKEKVEPDLRQYVQAFREDVWQPRRSGLCKAHCPVLTCEHNGRGR